MSKRFFVSMITLIALLQLSPRMDAQARQPGAVYDFDRKDEKAGPAPRHDISGVWEPAKGPGAGIAGKGAMAMEACRRDKATGNFAVQPNPPLTDTGYATPDCLRPEIEPPYTPLGLKRLMAHKPTEGYRMVPPALTNDPVPICDPQGFPRIVLHNFRTSEIIQTPNQVVILYEFNKKWRVIWTDSRDLPKDAERPSWTAQDPPESRWWGYSVGRWADDHTFVAESNGFDDDNAWIETNHRSCPWNRGRMPGGCCVGQRPSRGGRPDGLNTETGDGGRYLEERPSAPGDSAGRIYGNDGVLCRRSELKLH